MRGRYENTDKQRDLFNKTLVIGIILLFLCISTIPLSESLSIKKPSLIINSVKKLNTVTENVPMGIYVILHGPMGENGWFIGTDIWIEVIATNGSEVVSIFYRIDAGSWQIYTGGLLIWGSDGIHSLYVCVYDQYETAWYLL